MTQQSGPSMPTSRRSAWELGLLVLLRVTLSASLLFTAYYLIPTKSAGEGSDAPWLILELCVFGVVVGIQVPAIVKAKYPLQLDPPGRSWRAGEGSSGTPDGVAGPCLTRSGQ